MGDENNSGPIQSLVETLRLVLSRLEGLPSGGLAGLSKQVARLGDHLDREAELREKLASELEPIFTF